MENASVQDAVNEAMDEVRRALPRLAGAAPVHELEVELRTDLLGKPMASITVVLEDLPSGEPYPFERLSPIRDLLWDVFNERSPGAWPHTSFVLKSELEAEDEERQAAVGEA